MSPAFGTVRLSSADIRWRGWLLALCALGLLQVLCSALVFYPQHGDLGLLRVPIGVSPVDRLTVLPGGAAWRSGLRTGDLLDTQTLTGAVLERLDLPRANEPVSFTIVHNGATRSVTVVTAPKPQTWIDWLGHAGQLWVVLVGVLLVWRRPGSWEVRLLVLFLQLCYVTSQSLFFVSTPWPYVDRLAMLTGEVAYAPGFIAVLYYAGLFGRPLTVLRWVFLWMAYVVVSLGIIVGCLEVARVLTAVQVVRPIYGVLFLSVPCALIAATAASSGPARSRVAWATVAIAPAFAALALVGYLVPAWYSSIRLAAEIVWFVTPAILTYSLLSGRLYDLGFIVNRAAVFTGVSVVLLGTFVLVEWLLAEWLQGMSRSANIIVSAAVALALGLSIRFVHTRVDRIVDSVFFRKRHDDEQAIRRFAQEAPYVTDAALLVERAVAVLEAHTNAVSVEMVLDDGNGTYGGNSENDPAVLRLRATHEVVDLSGMDSALRGDLAFPMVSRGRLVGIVLLGARRSGEAYAPDESSAIAQLAHSVAAALDTLGRTHAMRTQVDALLTDVRASIGEIVAAANAPVREKLDELASALRGHAPPA